MANTPSFTAALREISGGFPSAHKVLILAVFFFSLFNLASALIAGTAIYESWLVVSQPLTDTVAKIVPAVFVATVFLENHRSFLEEHSTLYWIPAIRNVLSLDFGLFFSPRRVSR
jgi:hypothetical protein